MNETRKVVSGEPLSIPANTWNKLIDLVEPGSRPGAETYGIGNYPSVLKVLVQNSYDLSLDDGYHVLNRWDVVEINTIGPPIDYTDEPTEFKERPNFSARFITYPATSSQMILGVMLEPLEAQKIGYAAISGIVPVRVNVHDAAHTYARAISPGYAESPPYLESAKTGPCRILWKESGTGVKWAYVALPAMGTYMEFATFNGSFQLEQSPPRLTFNVNDFRVDVPGAASPSEQGYFKVSLNKTTISTSSWMGI